MSYNWHRYYHPLLGGYIQEDPLLTSSGYIRSAGTGGLSIAPYAYADGNPARNSDMNGLEVEPGPGCTEKIKKIVDKMRESLGAALKSKEDCECLKQIKKFELDAAFIEKELTVIYCYKTEVPSSKGACGYGGKPGQIEVSMRESCGSVAETIAHELGHRGGRKIHLSPETRGNFEKMARCFSADGSFLKDPAPEVWLQNGNKSSEPRGKTLW